MGRAVQIVFQVLANSKLVPGIAERVKVQVFFDDTAAVCEIEFHRFRSSENPLVILVYYNSILLDSRLDWHFAKARTASGMDQSVVLQRCFFLTKLVIVFFLALPAAFGLGQPRYVETVSHPGSFTIAKPGGAASLCVDGED